MKKVIVMIYILVGICILGSISKYFGLRILGEWNILFPIVALAGLIIAGILNKRLVNAR